MSEHDGRRERAREAERRYHAKNRDKRNAAATQFFKDNPDYKIERRQSVRAVVAARKMALGCSKCGYKDHPAALDWHHTDDTKEGIVGRADSIAQAEREMAKCVVLCANCHRVHHAEERGAHPKSIPAFDTNNPILEEI
jgi:hypothetical protein